jgi:hypothetical protein
MMSCYTEKASDPARSPIYHICGILYISPPLLLIMTVDRCQLSVEVNGKSTVLFIFEHLNIKASDLFRIKKHPPHIQATPSIQRRLSYTFSQLFMQAVIGEVLCHLMR